MSDTTPKVSMIILTKNEESGIGRCLEAVKGQKFPHALEIILIDSGSTDRTLEIVRGYPKIKIVQIRPEEFAHGRTRNLGAGQARGEFLVFLNGDAWPADDNWLKPLTDFLEAHRDCAGVYSRHLVKPGSKVAVRNSVSGIYMPSSDRLKCLKKMSARELSRPFALRKAVFFSTVSCAMRRSVWQDEPFDDSIDIAEDMEWSWRVQKKGYEIGYCAASKVFHSHEYSFDQWLNFSYRCNRVLGTILAERRRNVAGSFFYSVAWVSYNLCVDLFSMLVQMVPLRRLPGEIMYSIKMRLAESIGRFRANADMIQGRTTS